MVSLWVAAVLAMAPDAGLPAVETIHFDEAIRRALAQNVTTQIALEEIHRAEGLLGEACASSLPTAVAGASYTRLDGDRKFNGALIISKDQEAGNITVTFPLVAPSRWAQWSHGHDNLEVAIKSEADARRQIALAAGRAYLAVVAQKRVVEVTLRARDTSKAHYEYSHTRYAGGIGNRVDEVRALQALEANESQVEIAYTNLIRAREALGIVTGVDAPLDSAEEPRLPEGPAKTAAIAEAEANRADLKAAESRADAADHLVRDSWLDYLPSLLGVAQPFFQNPPTLTTPPSGWQAQLILSWTLYDGGIRPSQLKERRAGAAEAHRQLEATLRQAHSDVRLGYDELGRSEDSLLYARHAAEQARLAQDLAMQAYQAGATGNLEVIDAERTALDAETNAVIAEDAVRQARLDLLSATGHFP